MKKTMWRTGNRFKSAALAVAAMAAISTVQAEGTKQIFWEETALVKKMNLDGSEASILLQGHRVRGLYVDISNSFVYWWDTYFQTLYRTDIDGGNKTLIHKMDFSYGNSPYVESGSLVVDEKEEILYMSVYGSGYPQGPSGIVRINLKNSDAEWILNENNYGLEIDNDRLFWSNYNGEIESMNLDGTDRRVISTLSRVCQFTLDEENDVIYYTDEKVFTKVNFDGTDETQLFEMEKNWYISDAEYFQGRLFINNGRERNLVSVDLTGGDVQEIHSYLERTGCLHMGSDSRIYFSDPIEQSITSTDINGQNKKVNLQCGGAAQTLSLAVNDAEGALYVANITDILGKTDLKGTPLTAITKDQPDFVKGVTFSNDKVYWADKEEFIYRANFDGSNIETLPPVFKDPNFLFIDNNEEYLYIVDQNESIFRTDLDGTTDPELLFDIDGYRVMIFPYPEIGRIFYTEAERDELVSCNFDGSDKQVLATAKEDIGKLVIDKESDIIYWAADSAIYSADLDGSNKTRLYKSDSDDILYLALGTVPDETEQEKAFSCSDLSMWSITSGDIELSDNSTDGNSSLSITPSHGNGEVTSVDMKTIEVTNPSQTVLVDFLVGSDQPNPWWIGNVQLVLAVPSANIWYAGAGTVQLTPLPLDEWATVSYTLPQTVLDALNGEYNDLSISFKYTVSPGSGPYLLDNLRFE